jgi:hypothetical protein
MTTEEKVIDVLTSYGPTASPNDAIYAVDSEMGGWETAKSREFINGLRDRGLVHWSPEARDGKILHIRGEWKTGKP